MVQVWVSAWDLQDLGSCFATNSVYLYYLDLGHVYDLEIT